MQKHFFYRIELHYINLKRQKNFIRTINNNCKEFIFIPVTPNRNPTRYGWEKHERKIGMYKIIKNYIYKKLLDDYLKKRRDFTNNFRII